MCHSIVARRPVFSFLYPTNFLDFFFVYIHKKPNDRIKKSPPLHNIDALLYRRRMLLAGDREARTARVTDDDGLLRAMLLG